MSGRVCQFCGKPLWRLRRAEGDFCSPEHRNQYQLRRGFSQLAEGEKVAAIRRRREKEHITALQRPAGAVTLEPRRSFVWKNISARQDTVPALPLLVLPPHARLREAG